MKRIIIYVISLILLIAIISLFIFNNILNKNSNDDVKMPKKKTDITVTCIKKDEYIYIYNLYIKNSIINSFDEITIKKYYNEDEFNGDASFITDEWIIVDYDNQIIKKENLNQKLLDENGEIITLESNYYIDILKKDGYLCSEYFYQK